MACIEETLRGAPYGSGYEPRPLPVSPCVPSTLVACDPDEPIELPTLGCDYLERDLSGDLRCVD